MASSRLALNSVLGTVASLANSVGSIANTITTGIESVNDLAVNYRTNQQVRIKLDRVDFIDRMIEEKSEEVTLRQVRIEEYLAQNPTHLPIFNAAKAKFEAALAA